MQNKNRNWSEYNKSLVNRGSLTFWLDPKSLKSWNARPQKHKLGRPFTFSDHAITTAATLRYVFGLSLRAVQGFLKSIFKMLKIPFSVPCYTQICKRMKKIKLPSHLKKGKPVKHIVIDATGLKLYGEGEWKVKKHGVGKRRTWKKLHLAVDESTQEIVFAKYTKEHESDTKFIPEIVRKRKGVKRVLMDGAADSVELYRFLWERGVDLLTPPKKNARKRKEPWLQKRNERLIEILGFGGDKKAKSLWGKLSGYSKRATVESAIARWKKLFGQYLKSRCAENQEFEVIVKSLIMNKMKGLKGSAF